MRRANRTRAVVFDLDGTLLNSLPVVLSAICHALEPFGGRATKDIFARLGGPPAQFLTTLVDDLKNVPTALDRLESFHRDNVHLIQLFEGVSPLLARLRELEIQVAVWTGRDRNSTDWLLRHHQLGGFFATVVCGDDLATHKPNPEGLREILRRLRVAPVDTLLVGDSDVDVLGGVGCGVDTLLIQHDRVVELHIAEQSWQIVSSPRDAFELVLESVQSGL